ncbi:hypothetical protein TorRG33x02_085150, partial [Trema orientale]
WGGTATLEPCAAGLRNALGSEAHQVPQLHCGIRALLYSPLSSPSSKTLSSPPPPPHSASSPNSQAHPLLARPAQQNQTLYEMMSDEQHRESRLSDDKRRKLQDRVAKLLDDAPFRDPNWGGMVSDDMRLTVVARDLFRVSMDVHKSVFASKSRFFAEKLCRDRGVSHSIEISDCDDVEVYVEIVVLMYYEDLKKRLIGEEVSKVLGLLKENTERRIETLISDIVFGFMIEKIANFVVSCDLLSYKTFAK